jgi:hypothetical protein
VRVRFGSLVHMSPSASIESGFFLSILPMFLLGVQDCLELEGG